VSVKLQDALEALYGLERRKDKLGLDGERALLGALGHPERRFRSVHVAGTNGKGTACAVIERVLRETGLKTGLFTSPHLVDFRERIRIRGRWADGAFLEARLAHIQSLPDEGHLYAAHVINDLWRATKDADTIVVTDVGQHQMWEAQYYHHERPRSLITSGGLGTMGFAVPAAIGAKRARPDAEVWAVVGDGGFQMTMCELATAVQDGIAIKIAIINNGYLGMVRQWQEFFYERRYAATPLSGPDFVRLAEAFGIPARAVRARADVDAAIDAARRCDGPALVDFQVEQEDTVYPMVPAGADLHAMIRRPNPIVETAAD